MGRLFEFFFIFGSRLLKNLAYEEVPKKVQPKLIEFCLEL